MGALKFLLTVIFWIALLVCLVLILHFRDFNDAYKALQAVDPAESVSLLEAFRSYFQYADHWNKIYLTIMASVLLFLFVANDVWLRTRFAAQIEGMSFSYPTSVLTWLVLKAAAGVLVIVQFLFITNVVIAVSAEQHIFKSEDNIPGKKYALLLGTNKKLRTKEGDNLYYIYRIEAADRLYKSGKVDKIIISGDNNVIEYNEPADMMSDLVSKGIPKEDIILDFAGFRTLDSIVRLKYHFGVQDVIIISQKFHLQRALFLAWFYNIEAAGFAARGNMTASMFQREALAKPKAILDIFVFNMQPKFGRTASREPLQWFRDEHKVILVSVSLLLFTAAWFFIRSLRFQAGARA